MWRIISYYARVAYNLFRLPLWSVLNAGKIQFAPIQKLSPFAKISVGRTGSVKLGKRCMAEHSVYFRAGSGKLALGDKVFFNRNCIITCNEQIDIGNKATFGPNVCIYDHDHDPNNWNKMIRKPVSIGDRVWVGANAVILKGVTIGNDAVIAAGSIVTHDIPEKAVAGGVPAKVLKYRE